MSLVLNQSAIRSHKPAGLLKAALAGCALAFLSGIPASSAAPYSHSELKAVQASDEAKIEEIRNQEINQLRITLGRRLANNRRADLYIRLAEIYLEAYRAGFLLEGRVHEKRLEKGVPDKTIDRSYSKPFLAKGIQACKDVLKLGIRHPRLDQVYYILGFNYNEMGNRKESVKYFQQLVKRYPSSPLVSEAYQELGDAAYDGLEFRKAKTYFEAAAKREKDLGDAYPRMLHKLAWTYYRLKQFDRAVATLKQAISKTSASGEKFLSLREEAMKDMAIFMTESGRVEEAIRYFEEVTDDKEFYANTLERLGRQYERNVEPAKAAQVYESILKTSPKADAAFRVRVKLIDLELRRGRYKEALARLNGVEVPSGGDSDTQTAAQNLRAMVRRTATEHHERYRKQGTRTALAVAEDFYAAYLRYFLSKNDPRKETPEIQMYLADVKRELGKAKEASELYRKVVDSGDKRYAKEAGALWTASLADSIRKAGGSGSKPNPDGEPSALEKEFVEAADELSDALGDTPEAREAALKSAQVLAGYKKTKKDAVKRARKIVERSPKSSQALTAARLWLQIYADQLPKGNLAELEKSDAADDLKDAMEELRKNKALLAADQEQNGGKLRVFLAEMDNRFKVSSIAASEKEQDFESAAKGYETYANETKGSDLAEKAYANAVASYLKASDMESVNRVVGTWLKRYPKSTKAVDSIRSAATAALVGGQFEPSAVLFEKLGRGGSDPASLETAARLYEGNGNLPKAQELWKVFLDAYKTSPRRFAVALLLARSQDNDKQDTQAVKTYKLCMAGPAEIAAECGARLAELYFRLQEISQAHSLLKKVAASKGGAKSPFVGYARYRLAEIMEQEGRFSSMRPLQDKQLQKALEARVTFLERLSKAYQDVVKAGGPWGIAALNRLASWVVGVADDVDTVSPPAGADAARAAQFKKSLMNEVSGPLRQKALQTWKEAYSKAAQAEILSPMLPEIVDHLADHPSSSKPQSPSRAQGYRGRFRLAGVPADGGNDGRSTALEKARERLTKNTRDAGAWVDYGNLLWGMGKPLLAKLAYERALSLDSKNPAAHNNLGVVLVSGSGQEDWLLASESMAAFKQALRLEELFYPAKMNQALMLNYYRLFARAKPLWDQIAAKWPNADVYDGQATSLHGMGSIAQAETIFKKAAEAGASSKRFAKLFHEASRASTAGKSGPAKCLDLLGDLDEASLEGFEKRSVENLKRTCTAWKTEK